jgi:ethanolamine utilization protein EutQ (cupin superfamily)
MPEFIDSPTIIEAPGNIPKIIKEFVGCVNTGNQEISIAKMESPSDWKEPGQTPEFDEYTVVLKGSLFVETKGNTFKVNAGQAITVQKGEWVRYSTPGGAEYIAVCTPAFTPDTVHRDEE